MTKNLKWKAVLICSVIALALVYILPTFCNVPIWWKDNLPSEKISLGLDLQGGVHLLLEVEAGKAVENNTLADIGVSHKKYVHFLVLPINFH